MTDDVLRRIGRLAAVARALEREGGYNGAKLVRTALDRELTRYAEAASNEVAHGEGALDALRAVATELEAAGHPRALADAVRAAADDAVRNGGTITLAAAPRAHTCRFCGEVFLGERVPPACPACDAPALSYREQLPVWYLDPADPGTILAELASGPRRVAAALDGRDDEALARAPRPGEWSARETLEHLVFAEGLFAERIPRLLTEDEPDLVARAVWMETPPSDEGTAATGETASALAAEQRRLREATVARLTDLDAAAWARAGRHPEWGRVTVLSQAAYFVRHEASHLAQLAAAARGRVPGDPVTA